MSLTSWRNDGSVGVFLIAAENEREELFEFISQEYLVCDRAGLLHPLLVSESPVEHAQGQVVRVGLKDRLSNANSNKR